MKNFMFKISILSSIVTILLLASPQKAKSQFQAPLSPTIKTETIYSQEVSPLELKQFVNVIKHFQRIEMNMQHIMAKAMKKEGLTPEKFMEINKNQRQLNPNIDNSSEDLDKFRKVVVKLEEIMNNAEKKRQSTVKMQGLALERFLKIEEIVAKSKNLQEKVQKMLGN